MLIIMKTKRGEKLDGGMNGVHGAIVPDYYMLLSSEGRMIYQKDNLPNLICHYEDFDTDQMIRDRVPCYVFSFTPTGFYISTEYDLPKLTEKDAQPLYELIEGWLRIPVEQN